MSSATPSTPPSGARVSRAKRRVACATTPAMCCFCPTRSRSLIPRTPAHGASPNDPARERRARWRRSASGVVYVAWFFLPEDWRRARIGSRVLAMAEEEGRRRGCTRIALTTLSIEAPGFYQKQGYDVAATIDCEPPGLTRYYMMKRL